MSASFAVAVLLDSNSVSSASPLFDVARVSLLILFGRSGDQVAFPLLRRFPVEITVFPVNVRIPGERRKRTQLKSKTAGACVIKLYQRVVSRLACLN